MIPRIRLLWFVRASSILGVILSASLLSPVLSDGKWYYNCQQNPLECTYGKGKYAAASSSCEDRHPNCRDYAMRGNCIRNSQWMEAQCPLSCGTCPTTTTNNDDNDQDCIDHHPNCPKWANEQECFINPPFINGACPKSCIRCVNATQDMAHLLYAQTDFGVWQSLPRDNLHLVPATTQVLFEMGEYAQELLQEQVERLQEDGSSLPPLLGPSAVCNNMRNDCATLAAQNSCITQLEMMLQECSFACRFCHETYTYHKCRSTFSKADRISLSSTISSQQQSLNHYLWNHLSNKYGAVNLAAQDDSTKFQSEWVASLNYTAIWNDNNDATDAKKQQLLQVAKIAFEDDDDDDATTCSSDRRRRRKRTKSSSTGTSDAGRITTCNGPALTATTESGDSANTITVSSLSSSSCQDLAQEVARLLNVAPEYLEPLEFLHFDATKRQVPMSEFDIHNQWKPSGHVLFTVLLILQQPQKGGIIGFPNLDWLLVQNAEILIWPTFTMMGGHPQELPKMKLEILPVIQGDLYAIKIRVRQYPYVYNPDCET